MLLGNAMLGKFNNRLKLSMFINFTKNKLINDLNGSSYPYDMATADVIRDIEKRSLTSTELLKGSHGRFYKSITEFLIVNKILIPEHFDERGFFYPKKVDIETVRHCNARCVYCPQSIDLKPSKVMTIEVFKQILNKLKECKPSWVTFNHYGEPFLDPLFKVRTDLLSQSGIKLFLATNGTLITKDIIFFLEMVKLHSIHFNFPSIIKSQWSKMMGLPETQFQKAKDAIETILLKFSKILEINIVVNSIVGDREWRASKIKNHFQKFGKFNLILADTRSRCGTVCNKHVSTCDHKEIYFGGCERIVNHLYVSYEGKCFLCSDDYYQKIILGDLLKNDIHYIMNSEKTKKLKSEIFGLSPMRQNFICRKCVKLRKERNF